MDTNSRANGHLKQLQKASNILAWERRTHLDEAVALTSLYGLRIAAAADAYFADLGFETKSETAWRDLKKMSVGIGAAANQALDDLGRSLRVDALLHHPDFTALDEGDLVNAVATLDRIEVRNLTLSDLADASEALDGYIEWRNVTNTNRLLTTPMELNRMLTGLLLKGSRRVKTVYDPTCGFGGSLIAVYDELKRHGREKDVRFYAQDITPETTSVAAWRFLLRGVTDFDFAVGDTLLDPQFHKGRTLQRFDLVISVPYIYPTASMNMTSRDPYLRFSFGDVGRGRADYGFVQHVLASTAPKGRAVTTLALSSLARSGYEQEIRGRIVRADILDAVVSFPEFTDSNNKGMVGPTSALVFDKSKPDSAKDKVFFIDGHVEFPEIDLPSISLLPVPDHVMEVYSDKTERPDTSAWAQVEIIEAHEYSLLPKLYIPQSPLQLSDVATIEKRIRELSQALIDIQEEFEDDIMYLYGAMNSYLD